MALSHIRLEEWPDALAILQRTLELWKGTIDSFPDEVATFSNFPTMYCGTVAPKDQVALYLGYSFFAIFIGNYGDPAAADGNVAIFVGEKDCRADSLVAAAGRVGTINAGQNGDAQGVEKILEKINFHRKQMGKVASLIAVQSLEASEVKSILQILNRFRKKIKSIHLLELQGFLPFPTQPPSRQPVSSHRSPLPDRTIRKCHP